MSHFIINISCPDKVGIVKNISNNIKTIGGNWLESEVRHYRGIFSAIITISLPERQSTALHDFLEHHFAGQFLVAQTESTVAEALKANFSITCNDRPGIIEELSLLAEQSGCNIEAISSEQISASHCGTPLFTASVDVSHSDKQTLNNLIEACYALGDDVMIDTAQ